MLNTQKLTILVKIALGLGSIGFLVWLSTFYDVHHKSLFLIIGFSTILWRSTHILKEFVTGFHHGITVTCPGFYGPQGRILRMPLAMPNLVDQMTSFKYGNHHIANFEMETSAIYGLCNILGHQCLSINVIVANRVKKEYSKDMGQAVNNMIQKSLAIIENI